MKTIIKYAVVSIIAFLLGFLASKIFLNHEINEENYFYYYEQKPIVTGFGTLPFPDITIPSYFGMQAEIKEFFKKNYCTDSLRKYLSFSKNDYVVFSKNDFYIIYSNNSRSYKDLCPRSGVGSDDYIITPDTIYKVFLKPIIRINN